MSHWLLQLSVYDQILKKVALSVSISTAPFGETCGYRKEYSPLPQALQSLIHPPIVPALVYIASGAIVLACHSTHLQSLAFYQFPSHHQPASYTKRLRNGLTRCPTVTESNLTFARPLILHQH